MNKCSRFHQLAVVLGFLALPLSCFSQDRVTGASHPEKGPVTSDAEIISELNLNLPGLEKVKAAVQSGNIAAAERAYLDYRRHDTPVKWTVSPSDEPARASEADDAAGDLIVNHMLKPVSNADSLPKIVDMGKDFRWTYNPLSPKEPGYTDEWTYCSVSRMQFWEHLADAYWKTHDEKYARAWVDQLFDFAAKNPVPPGKQDMFSNALGATPILWRSLDISVRMDESWPYAYYHFLNSPAFTADAQWTYLKLVYEHGVRLSLGLDDPKRTGNWVSAEAFGLYTIGVLFPELRDSAKWRESALERLNKELNRMVAADGFEEELSPGYDMATIREFSGPIELAVLNHYPVSEPFRNKVMSMYRALILVMDQSGHDVPTNDSWPFNPVDIAEEGLKVADDPLLRWAVSGGKEGTAPPDSTMLPYAGFYAMRSGWKPDDVFLFFRGGPTGIGHEHEDMLEVAMRAWNRNLLIDPGTYS